MRDEVLHHLKHERKPVRRETVCVDLARIGSVSAEVDTATPSQWGDVIDQLIKSGDVIDTGDDNVVINRVRLQPVPSPPEPPEQRGLFE